MGDTHLAQGDSELDGTGIETSLNGKVRLEENSISFRRRCRAADRLETD